MDMRRKTNSHTGELELIRAQMRILEEEMEEIDEEEEADDEEEEMQQQADEEEACLILCAAAAYLAKRKRLDQQIRALVLKEYILTLELHARPRKSPRIPAPLFDWEEHVGFLKQSDGDGSWGHSAFRTRYRMTERAFNKLLEKLTPHLRSNATMSGVARGGYPIVPQVRDKRILLRAHPPTHTTRKHTPGPLPHTPGPLSGAPRGRASSIRRWIPARLVSCIPDWVEYGVANWEGSHRRDQQHR